MEENTPNDRAFIKVAMELRQLENAVMIGETMLKISKHISSAESSHRQNYGYGDDLKTMAKQCLGTDNCLEPYRSYYRFIQDVQTDFSTITPQLEKYRIRIAELKGLFDLYSQGKDIVMAKLSKNPDEPEDAGE